jgi:hypothetical protein
MSSTEAPRCVREEAARRATMAVQKALSFYKRGAMSHKKDTKQSTSTSIPQSIEQRVSQTPCSVVVVVVVVVVQPPPCNKSISVKAIVIIRY